MTYLPPYLVRNFIYPLYRGFRQDRLLEILEELEKNQWLTRSEIEDIQWMKLKSLLGYVERYVPYYRELFREHGISADRIEGPSDFAKIPLLSKEIIRINKDRLITEDPTKRGFPSSTGGSTGEPLYFFGDVSSGPVRRANTLRCYRWTGVDIGEPKAFLWGTSLNVPLKKRIVDGVKNLFNNILYLSTFDMSEEAIERHIIKLRKFRPSVLTAYPSALETLANYCGSKNRCEFGLKAIVTSGETLFPHQRELFEKVFDVPVFDRYGSREFSNVAHECARHNGLHIFSDLFYVEVLDEEGNPVAPGESGELVITDLSNYYMPFIRYRTGDVVVSSNRECDCGMSYPLIEKVEGRSFDVIRTLDGRVVGGFFWTWLSRAVPGIEKFQIVQRGLDGIIFNIVPGEGWKDEYRSVLEEKIKDNCGNDFKVAFIIKDDIPLTASGKMRFIVSEMSEKSYIKSKIHKARVTGIEPDGVDCIKIDSMLMELANIAPYEKVLIVDITNGSRVETFALPEESESGKIIVCGSVSGHIKEKDELSIMAFTWSSLPKVPFKNILVDDNNRFVRYLSSEEGND